MLDYLIFPFEELVSIFTFPTFHIIIQPTIHNMKTTSVLFALATALAVNCIPVRPDIQELSSRSEVPGIEIRRGNEAIAGRVPTYERRRDDITIIEARGTPVEEREAFDSPETRSLTLSSDNATSTDTFHRGQPVKEREAEAKKVEPSCFAASSSTDPGCVVNLRS